MNKKKKYKPIDWGDLRQEFEIMQSIPDEIFIYYMQNYKNRGILLDVKTVMEIKNILDKQKEKAV